MTLLPLRIRAAVVVAGLLASLVLAGCGGNEKTTTTGGGASATPSQTKDEQLAGRVPEAIRSDGKILVGTDSSYAPSEFLDTDGKTVIGFDVDLFNAVAQKLGLKADYVSAPFDNIIPGVTSGKYEIGVSSFTINDERKKTVNMVSYFNAGTQWSVKKGNPQQVDINNICGKKIAVQRGTVQADEDLPKRVAKCTTSKPTIDQYQGQDEATAAVVSGKDDAVLADSPVMAYAVKQTNGQLETLGDIYDSAPYGYVVAKDQTDFAKVLADTVKALIDDGTYKKVLEKWGVSDGAIDNPAVNP